MPAEKERKTARRWTREEVLALPDDGNRYELIDGELHVSPSPRWLHQTAVAELTTLIRAYVNRHRIGRFGLAPADIDLGNGRMVQPDVFVSARVGGRNPRDWEEAGIPLLAIEVLSPKRESYDRVVKRALYQKAGVPSFWIVDLDARAVEVWTPSAKRAAIETARLLWQPAANVADLEIDLHAFFTAVWDEA